MTEKSMTLYSSFWGKDNYKTFKMLPISQNAPFKEAIYDGETKVLAVIGTLKYSAFTFMDKLDKDGYKVLVQDVKKNVSKFGSTTKAVQAAEGFGIYPYVRERVVVDSFNEYYITEPSEIEAFILKFADNAIDFNYKKYLDAPPIKPAQPEEASQQETTVEAPEGLSLVKE